MVLVMSLWDDHAVDMLWLDSVYPPSNANPLPPGAKRGSCPPYSGKPGTVETDYANAYVTYSNIKCALPTASNPATPPRRTVGSPVA